MATASKAITLRYIQPGKDGNNGLTPIIDKGKWIYMRDPSDALRNATIEKFTGIEKTATEAKETADSKTSLDAVKNLSLEDFVKFGNSVATQSWVNGKGFALNSSIPTKLSQLTNDSGYTTIDEVEGKGYITSSQASTAMESALTRNSHNFISYDRQNNRFTLCANGTCQNISSGGSVVSDARMKDVAGDVVLSAAEIASLPAITFAYKNDEDRVIHCGTIAQEVRRVLPSAVGELPGGTLTMDYGNAAWVAVVNLAREVMELKEELRKHKNQ